MFISHVVKVLLWTTLCPSAFVAWFTLIPLIDWLIDWYIYSCCTISSATEAIQTSWLPHAVQPTHHMYSNTLLHICIVVKGHPLHHNYRYSTLEYQCLHPPDPMLILFCCLIAAGWHTYSTVQQFCNWWSPSWSKGVNYCPVTCSLENQSLHSFMQILRYHLIQNTQETGVKAVKMAAVFVWTS